MIIGAPKSKKVKVNWDSEEFKELDQKEEILGYERDLKGDRYVRICTAEKIP